MSGAICERHISRSEFGKQESRGLILSGQLLLYSQGFPSGLQTRVSDLTTRSGPERESPDLIAADLIDKAECMSGWAGLGWWGSAADWAGPLG